MRQAKATCPQCSEHMGYKPALLTRSPIKTLTCSCGFVFKPKANKTGRTDAQKRSQSQEKRSAKRNQAGRVSGSGSSHRAKGDIKDAGRLHGECKHTIRRSFTLKLDDLMKAEKEAALGESVLFEIEFQGVHPPRRYVVLTDERYQALRGNE
jgi:hypothetical protein